MKKLMEHQVLSKKAREEGMSRRTRRSERQKRNSAAPLKHAWGRRLQSSAVQASKWHIGQYSFKYPPLSCLH